MSKVSNQRISIICLILSIFYITGSLCLFPAIMPWDENGRILLASGKLNGLPTAFVPYSNICYGWILSVLYSAFSKINWYMIFSILIYCICLWAILRNTAMIGKLFIKKQWSFCLLFFLMLSFFHALLFYFITEIQFTYIAATSAVALIYCFGTDCFIRETDQRVLLQKEGKQLGNQFILMLLYFFLIVIRLSVFYMALPFLCLLFFLRIKKSGLKAVLCQIVFAGMIFIFLLLANSFAWSGTRGEEKNLDTYRSKIQDYGGMPDYKSNKFFYENLGISSAEHAVLKKGFWGIAEHATYNSLRQIVELKKQINKKDIKEVLSQVFDGQREVMPGFLIFMGMIFVVNVILSIKQRSIRYIFVTICSALIWLAECFYLQMNGRVLFRVIYITDIAFLVLLIVLLMFNICHLDISYNNSKTEIVWKRWALIMICTWGIAFSWDATNDNLKRYEELNKHNQAYHKVVEYVQSNPSCLFLCTMNYSDIYHLNNESVENMVKTVGWITITPEWQGKITGDYNNSIEALIKRKDIRMITDADYSISRLEKYLKEQGRKEFLSVSIIFETAVEADDTSFNVWKIQYQPEFDG